MNSAQNKSRKPGNDLTDRLFEPGWSGRFGAIMLTAMVAAVLIVMSLGVA